MSTNNNLFALLSRLLGVHQTIATATVTVGTTTTQLLLLSQPGLYRLTIQNTGATALNTFSIQGRNRDTDAWETVVSSGTDFTTIPTTLSGFLLRSNSSINPTTLAGSATWTGTIDTKTFISVRLIATVAAGTTTISAWAG